MDDELPGEQTPFEQAWGALNELYEGMTEETLKQIEQTAEITPIRWETENG